MGEPPIRDFKKYINFTGMADGMVGGVLPNVVFYFPILPQNDSISNEGGSRYWTMIASPIADMLGGQCLTTLSPPPPTENLLEDAGGVPSPAPSKECG